MRFHTKRLCYTLVCGTLFFMYFEGFYSIYKKENSERKEINCDTQRVAADCIHLPNFDNIQDNLGNKLGNETTIINVDIARRKDVVTQKIRNIYTKLQENSDSKQQRGGPCNLTKFHAQLKTSENSWQPVDINKMIYVFSAYYTQSIIYIIGVTQQRQVKVICQLWSPDKDGHIIVTKETTASVDQALRDGPARKYTSTIFKCPVNRNTIPSHISLVTKSCESPLNLLQVQDVTTSGQYQQQFTVCLSPLNFRYGRAYELIEWIELNKILGADKFVVYNYSSAINVAQVLDYYTKRNTAEVIQWRLPMGVDTFPKTKEPVEIHYFGQAAALNDCLFRCKKSSKFVVNIDVDEFIIPHSVRTNNWHDIINQADQASVYLFQNTFFRKDWDRVAINFPGKEIVDKLRLVTLQVYQHESKIFPAKLRSKYIARTSSVYHLMIHEVPSVPMLTIPADTGLLHHYRNWETPNDKKDWVNDTTVLKKFKTPIIENVKNVWKILSHVKMDIQ